MTEPNGNVKTAERIARLETSVDTIMHNHIPHLEAKMDRLEVKVDKNSTKLNWVFGGLVVINTLVQLVVSYLAK